MSERKHMPAWRATTALAALSIVTLWLGPPGPAASSGAGAVSAGGGAIAWSRAAGTPGARRNLQVTGRGTDGSDTLVVSWDPGGAGWDDFLACYCALYFYDAEGDSLGAFWQFGASRSNPRGVLVNLEPPSDTTLTPSLWQASTDGGTQYDFYGNSGKLRFTFYVALSHAYWIRGGHRYHVANVILSRQLADSLAGAGRPIIVELAWFKAYFGSDFVREYERSPERFASINDPTGVYLDRFRARYRYGRPRPWEPAPVARE